MRALSTAMMIAASLAAAGCGRKNNDKLSDAEVAASGGVGGKAGQADRRCTSAHTSDAVKAQLFAHAAEIRGGFADNYARIAGFSLLQLDGAAPLTSVGAGEAVDCRAHAVLRLPPGLHDSGGRTQVGGDIDYTVAPGGIVTLGAAEALTEPLATLSQGRAVAPVAPAPPMVPGTMMPAPGQLPTPVPPPPPPPRLAPPPEYGAKPSFDCALARTISEHAVCGNSNLAALDRAMASHYVGALSVANPAAARLLRDTRDPFLGYRERCGSDASCIDRVYRGRIQEIDDIVSGRWHGNR